jgi:hypothetical protein
LSLAMAHGRCAKSTTVEQKKVVARRATRYWDVDDSAIGESRGAVAWICRSTECESAVKAWTEWMG